MKYNISKHTEDEILDLLRDYLVKNYPDFATEQLGYDWQVHYDLNDGDVFGSSNASGNYFYPDLDYITLVHIRNYESTFEGWEDYVISGTTGKQDVEFGFDIKLDMDDDDWEELDWETKVELVKKKASKKLLENWDDTERDNAIDSLIEKVKEELSYSLPEGWTFKKEE